jgi:hypothetical protein
MVDGLREIVAQKDDDFGVLYYCLMSRLVHTTIHNVCLGTISGRRFFDTLNIGNFSMANVSACAPLDWNDPQTTFYKLYTDMVSDLCGTLNGLEVARAVKRLCCIPYTYDSDYELEYAWIMPA